MQAAPPSFCQKTTKCMAVALTTGTLYSSLKNTIRLKGLQQYNSLLVVNSERVNPSNAGIFLYKQWRPKGFFQFEIIINVSVSSLRFT